MNNLFLVYQAYGHKDILHEVLVSIYSLYKACKDQRPTVVVYTDSVSYLARLLPQDVIFESVLPSQWQAWKGPHAFVHRAKIEMLRHFCAHYDGSLLYCDTDTFFTHSPEPLFEELAKGRLMMHMDEGPLGHTKNVVFQKIKKFLSTYRYNGKSIPTSTHMWNAGVLGFTTKQKGILEEVLQLTDDLYQAYPKHVMEQLAFSFYFQQHTLSECTAIIFHYWDFKEYRIVLTRFFEAHKGESYEEWSQYITQILPTHLIQKKRDYMTQPYWYRKVLQWVGKEIKY